MREYAVIFEKTDTGYSAYCPDLPGLGSCGDDLDDARRMIQEGVEFHIESLLMHGEAIPEPTTIIGVVKTEIAETWRPALAKTA